MEHLSCRMKKMQMISHLKIGKANRKALQAHSLTVHTQHSLIDKTVSTENFIQEKVEDASEDATNYSKDNYCN